MKELDIAKRIASGELPPLVMYENHLLAAIRVTGTGAALEGEKPIYRNPDYYLCDDFLRSINGVSVIFEHPENGEYLNHDEYQNRNVGSSFYPYVKNDEAWTIARIYDSDAIEGFKHGIFKDTSPAVAVIKSKELQLKDGSILHIEGEPIYTDHIALLVNAGVWSKSLTNLTGIPTMDNPTPQTPETPPGDQMPVQQTVQEAEPAQSETNLFDMMSKVLAMVEGIDSRLGAVESKAANIEKLEAAEVETKPKMDAVEQKIQSIEQNLPAQMSDDDKVSLADTVEKTNHAARMIGVTVKNIPSDTPKSFIARALTELKQYSPSFKDTPVEVMVADKGMMYTCHSQILEDVKRAAMQPLKHGLANVARKIVEKLETGGTQTRYIGGDANTMYESISMPPMLIKQFGTGEFA
jgi:hypothetical protein